MVLATNQKWAHQQQQAAIILCVNVHTRAKAEVKVGGVSSFGNLLHQVLLLEIYREGEPGAMLCVVCMWRSVCVECCTCGMCVWVEECVWRGKAAG